MTSYGVSAQGFAPKPQAVITSEIEADELANMDPDVDTDPKGTIGQLNGIMASRFAELWAMLGKLAVSIDPDQAQGFLLDNVSAITGALRLPVKPSFVFVSVLFDAPGTYLAGTLVANVDGAPSIQFSNAQDFTVPAEVNGSPVSPTNPYEVLVDPTIPNSGVLFISVEDGPVEALSGTLTQISVPVSGWIAVTNPQDAKLGNLEEDDPSLRIRRGEELAAAGSGTQASLQSDLLLVPNVKAVKVIENPLDVADAESGTPAKSFQAIVYDGGSASNAQIAQVIWDDKPSGIQPFGSTPATAIDSEGNEQTVFFTRPSSRPVYLAYTVALAPGALLTTVAAAIKLAAVNLSQGFDPNLVALPPSTPGVLLPGSELFALVYRSLALKVPGVLDVPQLALDFTASPTALVNLTCSPTQILTVDSSRITVVSS